MRTSIVALSFAVATAAALIAPGCSEGAAIFDTPADAGGDGAAPGTSTEEDAAPARDGSAPEDAALADADASTDAAPACAAETVDYAASAAEQAAVASAVAAFETAHPGVTVTLSGASKAVQKIEGEVPVTLDASIVDPCDRAISALDAFFASNASLLRLPAGLKKTSCSYDSITDSEIVRLGGGTYFDGRPLVGKPTELLVHVRRDGHIKYWLGDYVAVLERPAVTTCLDAPGAVAAAVGAVLHYSAYKQCQYQGPGQVTLTSSDSYVPLGTAVLVDGSNRLHFVRLVDGFLAPSHVTNATVNSDLFCCTTASSKNCVGKTLAVDERTGEVLGEYLRCHTC